LFPLRRLGKNVLRVAEWFGGTFWWWIQKWHYRDLQQIGISFKSGKEMMRDQWSGRVPVIGGPWVDLLRKGEVPIFPGIAEITTDGAMFVDGRSEKFNDIVVAIGFTDRRFPLAGELPSFVRDGVLPGRPGLWICGTRPALNQIGHGARRVARRIARELRRA
jgi:hypothetical protein